MDITILGTGKMGTTLGTLLQRAGHNIIFGSRDIESAQKRLSASGLFQFRSPQSALNANETIIIATPWPVTEAFISGLQNWDGKTVIDITNALSPDISELMLEGKESAAERIARLLPTAKIAKAFNNINAGNLDNPTFCGEVAQLYYCSDHAQAGLVARQLIQDLGFRPVSCGELKNARYLEAMAMLWIQLAFVEDLGMNFNFQLVSKAGQAIS